MLLYTDGLVERRDKPIGAQLDRLEMALRDSPSDLDDCCDFLLRAMEVDDEAGDDTALLVLRVENASRDRFRLELPAEAEDLRRVRRELALWLDALGVNRQEAHAVVTACNEACANAVEHAYGVHEAGAIHVEAALEGDEIAVSVRDFGAWPEAGSSRARFEIDRGRGFMLMNGLADHVDVSRGQDGTNVVIRNRLAVRASA